MGWEAVLTVHWWRWECGVEVGGSTDSSPVEMGVGVVSGGGGGGAVLTVHRCRWGGEVVLTVHFLEGEGAILRIHLRQRNSVESQSICQSMN